MTNQHVVIKSVPKSIIIGYHQQVVNRGWSNFIHH